MNKFKIAGRELMKGNIGNAITAIATKSITSELIQPARWRNGNYFFGVNGADKAFIWGGYNSSLRAYQQCPVVSSIILRQAQATVNGRPAVMDEKGKESKLPQAVALKALLKRPNAIQNGKQFRAQGNVYKRIYGYCPVLIVKPVGFENDFTKWKLWNIPPWMLQVTDSTDLFFLSTAKQFQYIRLTYMGHSINLDPDSIFFLRENQISTGTFMSNSSQENVSMFLPDSKLLQLEEPIDNMIASLKSRGSLIRKRGPLWIMSNDGGDNDGAGLFPIDPDTKEELQKDFMQYGIMGDQRKAVITDAKVKIQSVGFDMAQLQLLPSEVQDAKHISDGLNFPPYLLGLVDAKFDNQEIAERGMYTNSIIPDCESDDEQWGEIFGLDEFGLKITTDYSHLPALQENITEQGRGRWYMNQALLIEWLQDGITYNRWRELLGEDTVPGMDIYYSDMVKSGRILPPSPTKNPADPAPNVSTDTQATQTEAAAGSANNSNNG